MNNKLSDYFEQQKKILLNKGRDSEIIDEFISAITNEINHDFFSKMSVLKTCSSKASFLKYWQLQIIHWTSGFTSEIFETIFCNTQEERDLEKVDLFVFYILLDKAFCILDEADAWVLRDEKPKYFSVNQGLFQLSRYAQKSAAYMALDEADLNENYPISSLNYLMNYYGHELSPKALQATLEKLRRRKQLKQLIKR